MSIWQPYKDFYALPKSDPPPSIGDAIYRLSASLSLYAIGISFALALATMDAWSAEAHAGHPEDMAMHEKFYNGWNQPHVRDPKDGHRTASCCNKQDCYATPIKLHNGNYYARRREDGRWLLVPASILEQNYMDPRTSAGDGRESPDGQSHVCMSMPFGSMAYEYGDAPVDVVPTKLPFEIAVDGTVYCATLGGAT